MPGSVKARLVEVALKAFGERGYDGAAVGDLAKAAGVTTGALYHHFGSKLGLYAVVREELERRVVDRMEGAAAAFEDRRAAVRAALLVGYDAALKFGAARLLSEPDPRRGEDAVAAALERILRPAPAAQATPSPAAGSAAPDAPAAGEAHGSHGGDVPPGLAEVLAAAWRAALARAARTGDADGPRRALAWLV